MIAADTSTWVAFLRGAPGNDVQLLDEALSERRVMMVPVVLSELLSDPDLDKKSVAAILDLPLLPTAPGYWERAGLLRAKVLAKRRRARLGDCLIAQCCIDEGLSLLTRDRDFRAFFEAAGLDLLIPY